MFGKKHTSMKSLIGSFTSEAKAIADAQKKIAEEKLAEIEAAKVVYDAAIDEAASAEMFIENMTAMCCPAVKAECCAEPVALAKEVK